jgi:hypothetical protein
MAGAGAGRRAVDRGDRTRGGARSVDGRLLGQQTRPHVAACAQARGPRRDRARDARGAGGGRPADSRDGRAARGQLHHRPALAPALRAGDSAGRQAGVHQAWRGRPDSTGASVRSWPRRSGAIASSLSLVRVREELQNCVLLCARCHAEVEVGVTRLPLPTKGPARAADESDVAVVSWRSTRRSGVAQSAEHSAVNRRVVGSSPTPGASERRPRRRLSRIGAARRVGRGATRARPGATPAGRRTPGPARARLRWSGRRSAGRARRARGGCARPGGPPGGRRARR